jgi:hypothetical protein
LSKLLSLLFITRYQALGLTTEFIDIARTESKIIKKDEKSLSKRLPFLLSRLFFKFLTGWVQQQDDAVAGDIQDVEAVEETVTVGQSPKSP